MPMQEGLEEPVVDELLNKMFVSKNKITTDMWIRLNKKDSVGNLNDRGTENNPGMSTDLAISKKRSAEAIAAESRVAKMPRHWENAISNKHSEFHVDLSGNDIGDKICT